VTQRHAAHTRVLQFTKHVINRIALIVKAYRCNQLRTIFPQRSALRITPSLDEHTGDRQCGCRRNRSAVSVIVTGQLCQTS
jgi:hypothetical protein